MYNLLFCAHTPSYVTKTLLWVIVSIDSKQILCFVHSEGQKREKNTTINYGQRYKFETKLNYFTDYWRFPLDQKFWKFRNGQMIQKFLGKLPENPVNVDFPRSEPFNQKFQGFREQGQKERKFQVGNFWKFQYTSIPHKVPFSGNFGKCSGCSIRHW